MPEGLAVVAAWPNPSTRPSCRKLGRREHTARERRIVPLCSASPPACSRIVPGGVPCRGRSIRCSANSGTNSGRAGCVGHAVGEWHAIRRLATRQGPVLSSPISSVPGFTPRHVRSSNSARCAPCPRACPARVKAERTLAPRLSALRVGGTSFCEHVCSKHRSHHRRLRAGARSRRDALSRNNSQSLSCPVLAWRRHRCFSAHLRGGASEHLPVQHCLPLGANLRLAL